MSDPLREAYIRKLEDEIEVLRERVRQLEESDVLQLLPIEFALTSHEYRTVEVLMKREQATKEQIMTALYGLTPDGDEPEIKIVDVYVCKARKKLRKFGIDITTVWGRGYTLSPAMKDKIRGIAAKNATDRSAA